MDSQGKIHGIKHEKELKEKIDGIVLRRTIDEVWKDRPEIIETYIECAMDKKQATFYAQTRDGVLQQLKDLEMQDNINQASIGALITYLLMASCTVKAIDPETDIKQHSSKMETLKEILTEEFPDEAKMVIFSRFSNKVTPHLIQEMEKWGVGPILYAKAGNQKLMDSVIEKFKTKEQYRFLVCSDALAYGANFQNANYLVNFDLPWNPAVLDQRIRRIYRRGQHKNVTIMNLIVPGTIEEDLVQTLNEKRALFTKFLKESKTGSNKSNKKSASLSIQEMIKLL
jgi:SNF2 family DNA or RNA helicase